MMRDTDHVTIHATEIKKTECFVTHYTELPELVCPLALIIKLHIKPIM